MEKRENLIYPQPRPESIKVAKRMVASQLTKEQFETLSEGRFLDVARWLENGWGVEAHFEDAERREDGTYIYAEIVILPVIPENQIERPSRSII